MATASGQLLHGVIVENDGKSTQHIDFELAEATIADIKEANRIAERLISDIDENGETVTEVVTSPMELSLETLRRQITKLGALPMPLDILIFNGLSATDLNILNKKAEELEKASAEVANRGRAEPASSDAEKTHESP